MRLGLASTLIRSEYATKTHRFENAVESEYKWKRIRIGLVWTLENGYVWKRWRHTHRLPLFANPICLPIFPNPDVSHYWNWAKNYGHMLSIQGIFKVELLHIVRFKAVFHFTRIVPKGSVSLCFLSAEWFWDKRKCYVLLRYAWSGKRPLCTAIHGTGSQIDI